MHQDGTHLHLPGIVWQHVVEQAYGLPATLNPGAPPVTPTHCAANLRLLAALVCTNKHVAEVALEARPLEVAWRMACTLLLEAAASPWCQRLPCLTASSLPPICRHTNKLI